MKIKIVALLFVFASCTNEVTTTATKKQKVNKTLTSKKTSVQDTIPTELSYTITEAWDSTLIIGEGIIWREEEIEGSGIWKAVHLTNVFGFKRKVKRGEKVLVIPLNKKLVTLNLKIKTVSKIPADEMSDAWYDLEFENIAHKSYWKAQATEGNAEQYPSSVICIYPVIENTQLLSAKEYENSDLPERINKKIVIAAVDFNDDKKPDALKCSFCCSGRAPVSEKCEFKSCEEYYVKCKGVWKLINTSSAR